MNKVITNRINQKFLNIINNLFYKVENKQNIKILDWGCGKGELVKFLNDCGFDCYGIDIDNLKIGKTLINGNKSLKGRIHIIQDNNLTSFESNYFDLILTNQVIEHISNKESFIREVKRVLKKGGFSYNILPAKHRILEVHFKMPLVHWLPKNEIRKYLIYFFNLFKFSHWLECKNLTYNHQVNYYYNYSVNKTFYIEANDLFNNFKKQDFYVTNPCLKNSFIINSFFQFIKKKFISIEFLATKK